MSESPADKESLSSKRKDALDIYWKMYNEHATQARHHEILRGTISTILISLSTAILAYFSATYKGLDHSLQNKYIGLTLIAVGLLGALLSFKHYERNRLHVSILRSYKDEMEKILQPINISIKKPNDKGRKKHENDYLISSSFLSANKLWTAVFVLIILAGMQILGFFAAINHGWEGM